MFPQKLKLLFFLLIALMYGKTYAADFEALLEQLMSVKSLACEFPVGVSQKWNENDQLKLEESITSATIYFRDINMNSRTATMIELSGESVVHVHVSSTGLSFFDSPELGNPVYITIYPVLYDKTKKEKEALRFIATMSRHVLLATLNDMPIPSQYYGYCEVVK